MSEALPSSQQSRLLPEPQTEPTPEQVADLATKEYAHSTHNPAYGLYKRAEVYRWADQQVDYPVAAYDNLNCGRDETILETGCSYGEALIRIRLGTTERLPHTGKLLGVDIDTRIFAAGMSVNERFNKPVPTRIDFIAAMGEQLPLKDSSVDGAMSLFMAYHTDHTAMLGELARVMKPYRRLVVATSGPDNKKEQREFERKMAGFITKFSGVETTPPPIFTQPFDTVVAERVLPEFFVVAHRIVQKCMLRIPPPYQGDDLGCGAYLESLDSMKIHFSPEPTTEAWNEAMYNIAWQGMKRQFKKNGYFEDRVDRVAYVCINNKEATE